MTVHGEKIQKILSLSDVEIKHIRRLIGSWSILSDLAFADLVLLLPTSPTESGEIRPAEVSEFTGRQDIDFIAIAHQRPTTNQTCYPTYIVERRWPSAASGLIRRAWSSGEIVDGEGHVDDGTEPTRVRCVPVRCDRKQIAVLLRESPVVLNRRPGDLERFYHDSANIFLKMVAAGEFPFANHPVGGEGAPRVGDGTMVFDADAHIQFTSPNAINAMHRMGVTGNVIDESLESLGLPTSIVRNAIGTKRPTSEEFEMTKGVVVRIDAIPFIQGGVVVGALALIRDVTDARRLGRLILNKESAIREVHHRVKNNLQTISALLRLQARRTDQLDAKEALSEAERRVRSIAIVHEYLSRDPNDQVPFNSILSAIVHMAEESILAERYHVSFSIKGNAGDLVAEVATPLALVLTELVQNAVEHAFVGCTSGHVELELSNDSHTLLAIVSDNGIGFPKDFDIALSSSLGMSIINDLVHSQLNGSIEFLNSGSGTKTRITIPLNYY